MAELVEQYFKKAQKLVSTDLCNAMPGMRIVLPEVGSRSKCVRCSSSPFPTNLLNNPNLMTTVKQNKKILKPRIIFLSGISDFEIIEFIRVLNIPDFSCICINQPEKINRYQPVFHIKPFQHFVRKTCQQM